jgi:hypothetical protein
MKKLLLALAPLLLLIATPSESVASSNPPVKMSNSSICHPKGGTYYSRTKNFTPYPTMAACVRAGGRPPKR